MSDLVLLTAEEVATKLKVHIKTVYANRDLPRVELAEGTIRFIEEDIDAYIRTKISRKPKPTRRNSAKSYATSA